jgi:hypothetical protein
MFVFVFFVYYPFIKERFCGRGLQQFFLYLILLALYCPVLYLWVLIQRLRMTVKNETCITVRLFSLFALQSFSRCHICVFLTSNFSRRFFYGSATQMGLGHLCEVSRSHSSGHITPVGLLWTSDRTVAATSTWRHTTLTTNRHQCLRRDSNPQSQQASGGRPTPLTARPLGSIIFVYVSSAFHTVRYSDLSWHNCTNCSAVREGFRLHVSPSLSRTFLPEFNRVA